MIYNSKMTAHSPLRYFRVSAWIFSVLLSCVTGLSAQTPQRIVSLNLCADQLLQTLADPDHILGLSPLARDPALSLFAREAERFPSIPPKSEVVLQLKPDLVLLAPQGQSLLAAKLQEEGIAVLPVSGWTTLADGETQIRALAHRLGQEARGEQLIGRIKQALQHSLGKPLDRSRSVLEIERRLYSPGHTSLIAHLLHVWQIPNRADQPALQAGGFIALERLIQLAPDRLLISNGNEPDDTQTSGDDMGLALLRHPALQSKEIRPITLPARLTLCGGPATITLIETLSDALQTGH